MSHADRGYADAKEFIKHEKIPRLFKSPPRVNP